MIKHLWHILEIIETKKELNSNWIIILYKFVLDRHML